MSAENGAGSGTADIAKQQVSSVSRSAGDAAGHVATTAQDQAREVVSEAKAQVSDLGRQFKSQVDEQANTQRDRVVGTLRSLSDELETMADNGDQSGLATDAARQLADRGRRAAGFLEDKQPGDLMQQVTDFARRRPGVFLLGAAAAGLFAGRLTRGVTADSASDSSQEYEAAGLDTASQLPVRPADYPAADPYAPVPAAGGYGTATPSPVPAYPYSATPPPVPAYGSGPDFSAHQTYPPATYPAEPYPTESYPAQYPAPSGDQTADAPREGYRP